MNQTNQQTRTRKATPSESSREWRKRNKQHIAEYRRAYRQKQRAARQAQSAAPSLLVGTLQTICDQLDRIESVLGVLLFAHESSEQGPSQKPAAHRKPKRMFS